jgi:hypothetical protein
MDGLAKGPSGGQVWPVGTTVGLARCGTYPGRQPGRAEVSHPGLAQPRADHRGSVRPLALPRPYHPGSHPRNRHQSVPRDRRV